MAKSLMIRPGGGRGYARATPSGVGPVEPPKFAAMQHDNAAWLSDPTRRAIAAGYDLVMCGIGLGTANVPSNLDAMRAINPAIKISQYTQVWEVRARGVLAVQLASGTTYRFTIDGSAEGASSGTYGGAGQQIKLRNFETSAFNGIWTIAAVNASNGVGGRATFDINIGSNPTITGDDGTASLGTCYLTSDAHYTRYSLVAENGPAEGWFLRGTVNGFANRIKHSGVATGIVRAVNHTACVVPQSGTGYYYPRVKADFDKTNLFDPFQPTVGDPLIVWIDNWNYKQRQGGLWGETPGGPVGSTEYTSSDTGVAARNRGALKDYADRFRALYPGVKIIGNADGVSGAAPAGIPSLTGFSEWPAETLDGAFIEEIYGSDGAGAEDPNKIGSLYNDNWVKLQGRLKDQRSMLADPDLHVVHVAGRGANNAAQQADYQFFVVGLAATLMNGTARANMSHYAFAPVLHDVTVDHVRHDERDAALGEPVDGEQSAARGWSGATTAWARAFQGGVVIANASTTTQVTITNAHLQTLTGYPFRRISGTTNPFNTGANEDGPFDLPAKSAVILLRR